MFWPSMTGGTANAVMASVVAAKNASVDFIGNVLQTLHSAECAAMDGLRSSHSQRSPSSIAMRAEPGQQDRQVTDVNDASGIAVRVQVKARVRGRPAESRQERRQIAQINNAGGVAVRIDIAQTR